jgi:hypothetical protein
LKHCAANRKRQLSALPNLGQYIYDVSWLRVKVLFAAKECILLRMNPHILWGYFIFLLLVCCKFLKPDTHFTLAVDFDFDGFIGHY